MACSSCRKPPQRIVRQPSTSPSGPAKPVSNDKPKSSGDQRSRIVGLTYVPK